MKVVYLESRGSFRSDCDALHSDTLFGLLCWAIRQVFSEEELVRLLKRFADGDPPFLISSAFPCRQEEGKVMHFLPRPLLPPMEMKAELSPGEAQKLKEFKRLRWIPEEHFSGFLQGRYSEGEYYAAEEWGKIKQPVIRRIDRLRARIDRLSGTTDGAGTLFTAPEYRPQDGVLYFLLKGKEVGMVERCLGFLEDFGWGGGNSIGHGQFRTRVEERVIFTEPETSDRFVVLSLYHPYQEELAHFRQGDAWYELVMRKGKVGGHFLHVPDFWKQSVMMFSPGSTFPLIAGRQVYGDNPIVKKREPGKLPFDVQQFGYAFAAGMRTARE